MQNMNEKQQLCALVCADIRSVMPQSRTAHAVYDRLRSKSTELFIYFLSGTSLPIPPDEKPPAPVKEPPQKPAHSPIPPEMPPPEPQKVPPPPISPISIAKETLYRVCA